MKVSHKITESYQGIKYPHFVPQVILTEQAAWTRSFVKGGSTYGEYIVLLGGSPVLIKGHTEENLSYKMSIHIS